MKVRSRPNSEGMALIVAVIAVLVLSVLAAGFALSMKVEARLTFNSNAETQLYWLGRSGVERARWILSQESRVPNEPYDALNQIWAGGTGGPGETNGPLAGLNLNDYPIGDGFVSLKIIDCERYANINSVDTPLLQQALNYIGVDANDISVVSDSIQDWVQPGNSPRVAGAKDDYYMGLDPPYHCKEAPMDDISEVLLVRGVTEQMFDPRHFNATNQMRSPFSHRMGFAGGSDEGLNSTNNVGLVDLFRAVSSGRININTANSDVLHVIPNIDDASVEAILKYRAGPDGVEGTDDDTPFSSVGQVAGIGGVNPAVAAAMNTYCGTRSNVFEVHVTARVGAITREYVALLWRSSGMDVRVVSFNWVAPEQ